MAPPQLEKTINPLWKTSYQINERGCGHFLGLPKRRSQVMPDTLQDSYILMTLLFCLRYTSGDSYPTPA